MNPRDMVNKAHGKPYTLSNIDLKAQKLINRVLKENRIFNEYLSQFYDTKLVAFIFS